MPAPDWLTPAGEAYVRTQEMKLNTRMIGDAGEYFVAFQLSRLGIIPALVSKGSKSVDLIATADGAKSTSIQVKTTAWPAPSLQWDVGSNKPIPSDSFFFVFVNIWTDGSSAPEAYVVPSRVVLERATWNSKRPQFHLTKSMADQFRDNWQSIRDAVF